MEDWFWGNTPAGFKRVAAQCGRMLVVREELGDFLVALNLSGGSESPIRASRFRGRSSLTSVALADGTAALVRSYHRGGMVRYLTKDLFCTWPPRPFLELAVTEHARCRGISTLEVMGACIERSWGPFYRGWLVTRELTGARDLWSILREESYAGSETKRLLQAVARSIRWMHRQGFYHRDLNLKNVLVRSESGALRVYIIDFDKARFFCHAISDGKAESNLDRLYRSIRKLDPDQRRVSKEEWDWFRRFYREAHLHET
ncbi:MAG: lipopolysaccharide kinase InaA family protein [Candidatus Binatia bacterium]